MEPWGTAAPCAASTHPTRTRCATLLPTCWRDSRSRSANGLAAHYEAWENMQPCAVRQLLLHGPHSLARPFLPLPVAAGWQVGWSKPVAVLYKDNMPAGKLVALLWS